jgi:hypothetical protein
MAKFLMLLHETPGVLAGYSPEENQQVIQKYVAWVEKMQSQGKMHEHAKLRDEGGRALRKEGTSVLVTDGPYSETKEVIAGYFVIEADGYDQAAKLAEDCPHLSYGWITLREHDPLEE